MAFACLYFGAADKIAAAAQYCKNIEVYGRFKNRSCRSPRPVLRRSFDCSRPGAASPARRVFFGGLGFA